MKKFKDEKRIISDAVITGKRIGYTVSSEEMDWYFMLSKEKLKKEVCEEEKYIYWMTSGK